MSLVTAQPSFLRSAATTAAGIAVAEAAAPTVKRVHQELGGKAPNIVLPATDLGKYLADTLQGVLRNSGQTCVAPTRLLVQTDQVAEVEAFAAALFTATAVDRPDQPGDHIGPVINKAQFDKIQKAIATAIAEGAAVIAGGLGRPQKFNAGYYVRPTVLSGVTPDMGIYRDEVFGPVATISQYTSIEEAIAMANDTEYGLSATITGDPVIAREIARKLRTGLVTINSWGPLVDAPFGGYKKSGNGREGGVCGLRDFLEVKTIVG